MNNYLKEIEEIINANINYNVIDHYHENKFPKDAWSFIMNEVVSSIDYNILDGAAICNIFEAIGYSSEDGGLNFAMGAQTLAATIPFWIYASNEQKEKYFNQLKNGSLICANAITEPEAGSDIFSMKTSAIKNENTYSLNGLKTFCSSIKEADLAVVYAVTNKNKGAHGGISAFIIEKAQFKVGQIYAKMGLRTCSIGELILDNSSLDVSQLIGKEGAGLGIFTTAMDWERIGLSAIYVGTMQRLFEQSLAYAKTRTQGDKEIGKNQAISHKIAEMKTTIHSCRIMIYNAAKKLGKERTVSELASICKLYVSESYIKICQNAMQIHGGNGYMEEYEIERCLRDAQASTIYSGTSEIQKNIIAKWNGL
ncbi:MAG: acyl-CoA dehydrogenase [Vicingaceae bacterium]|nr:acyl-CoA dehydrogenase [Vicingaceae bacterium]